MGSRGIPVVSIIASDSLAGEPGSGKGTGRITLTRVGDIAGPITVNLVYSGTAVAGVDYVAMPMEVSFGAGIATVNRTLTVPKLATVTVLATALGGGSDG